MNGQKLAARGFPDTRGLRQDDGKFQASLGNLARVCLKTEI